MTGVVRAVAAAAIAATAAGAGAIPPGASRATVTITASVAAQAQLAGSGTRLCLWSNTATRLLAVSASDADGTMRTLTPSGAMVAAATPACGAGDPPTAALLSAAGGARTILVSPE